MSDYDAIGCMEAVCATPLEKLALICVCYWRPNDQGDGEQFKPFLVERGEIAEFCGCSRDEAAQAVSSLASAGFFVLQAYSTKYLQLRFDELKLSERQDPEALGAPFVADLERETYSSGDARPARPPWQTSGYRQRVKLWFAQDGRCWYCGCSLAVHEHHWTYDGGGGRHNGWQPVEGFFAPMIEHQTPRTRGGGNDKQNKVLSCAGCNTRKSDRRVEEFRDWCEQNGWPTPVVFHGEQLQLAIASERTE